MNNPIEGMLQRWLRNRHEIQERAMEEALAGGLHGVSSIEEDFSCLSRVDPNVPYGQHFIFPSQDAYDRWVENGKPL